ncbi:MAG: hypothetical protein FWG10_04020 [Eubacteriaceae bacterium]|nr:hypothetical protein [Eubacteriaceae bacterium]
MTEELKKLYDERVNRFVTTADIKEPDRVPVMSQVSTWAVNYSGNTFAGLLENYEAEAEAYTKANEGFYYDGIRSVGINHLTKTGFELESKTFFISPNGITLQHHESSSMREDEYDEFLGDPMRFIADKIAVRKVRAFQLDDEEQVYQNLSKLFDKSAEIRRNTIVGPTVVEKTGLPFCVAGSVAHPMDDYFDFIRGFKPTMTDLRRRPEKVLAAVEALMPYHERNIPKAERPPLPWVQDTHHIATFLTKQLFELVYWPFYKKTVEGCFAVGTKLFSHFEGSWEQHYDFLEDLPKTSVVAIVEPTDVAGFKARFADRFTIASGVSTSMLRFMSADECIEEAKRVVGIAAPGGGFVFATERSLISPNDANPDVIRAVNKYISENTYY